MNFHFGSENWEDKGSISREGLRTYLKNPQRLYVWEFNLDENKKNLLFKILTIMNTKLNAQWIVGFTDGEGCFNLDVHIKKDMKWGLQMQPEFTVVQNEVDIQLLYAFKDYFKCGSIAVNREDDYGKRYHYRVKNVKDLKEKILPFFEKHSLKTKKNVEFKTFRKIVLKMSAGYHRESLDNFLEIIDLGESLRVRSRPKKGQKGAKVAVVIQQLRELKAKLDQEKALKENNQS